MMCELTEDGPEWPREIWLQELDEHHNGLAFAVLSEHATIPRWDGDVTRDCEYHAYVDADIYESAKRYWEHQIEAVQQAMSDQEADVTVLADENAQLKRLLREAADLLSVERDALISGIGIGDKISDDPADKPARDAISEIDKWIDRARKAVGNRQ